jgi:soluble lytic murein transglycosylase-like protein
MSVPEHRHRCPPDRFRLAAPAASGPGFLLCCALLLVFGLCGGFSAQAAEPSQPSRPDPRGNLPAAPAAAQAATTADTADGACRPLAEAAPAGTSPGVDGTAGLLAGTFAGFADQAPTAAEPPPAGAASAAGAADLAPQLVNRAAAPVPQAPAAAAGSPGAPELATAVAAAAPPEPLPVPSLAFDPSFGIPPTRFGKLIYQTASRYALNPLLVAALVEVESDFNPRARSRKGACGLMQLLPATARRFGVWRRRDLFNPKKNLEVGSRYLRWLIDRFGADPARVLAAYNAGEGAVDRFGGVPPFAETRDYVTRIFAELGFSVLLDAAPAALGGVGATAGLDTVGGTK